MPTQYFFDAIKHLHFLVKDGKEYPLIGTTTAISILDKPLAYWASGLAVTELGWSPINDKETKKKVPIEQRLPIASKRFEEVKKLSDIEYLGLLDKAYKAHAQSRDKSKDKGVDMHLLLEQYIQGRIEAKESPVPPEIEAFVRWSEKNVKQFLFTEMHCYSDILHCGGVADFGYLDTNGDFVLGDFKSSAVPYYSHFLQCGGYQLQIEENGGYTPEGKKIFDSRPIMYHAIFCERNGLDKPFFNRQTDKMRRAFSYTVNLYREKIWWDDGNFVEGGK